MFERFRKLMWSSESKSDSFALEASALIDLGNTLEDEGLIDEAMAHYEAAIRLAPSLARAHLNRGNLLLEKGDLDGALAAYATALVHDSGYAAAHYNTGNALLHLDRQAALVAYDKALELKPDFVDAEVARGNVLLDLGQVHISVASYRRALTIKPDFAEVHSNLGNALKMLGQSDSAIMSYRRALAITPSCSEAHCGLGTALKDLGQLDDAIASYRRALEIRPDYLDAQNNLLFTYNFLANQSDSLLFSEARRYGEIVASQAHPYTTWFNTPEPSRCLRVGLLSGDLGNHPVGYCTESVMAALRLDASDRLMLIVYQSHLGTDAITERIKASCHEWYSVLSLSDGILAQRIRDDGIDILIDLSGPARLPLFAFRPAPVQVSWLGSLSTTGMSAMDYFVADPWTLTESEEANFTEKILRLPETRLCFTAPDEKVETSPLPALTNGYITFGCFNNLSKMNDDVVALWAEILVAVPHSRLFLKAKQLKEDFVCRGVVERFAKHGIYGDRLMLEGPAPRAAYLEAYHRVDIALDPFPYPGGVTSIEAFWMGVPVLTLQGARFLSRQGLSLLKNAGLPEWIAEDADDYVARAVLHASDLQKLSFLRNNLRQQVLSSPIFDAPRFAKHFEVALRGMWQRWCEQQKCESAQAPLSH